MSDAGLNYYFVLSISYGTAFVGWWLMLGRLKPLQPPGHTITLIKPWLQVGGIVLCAVVTILIGRLYSSGNLVPAINLGDFKLSEVLNQLLIFLPFPLFLVITRQSFSSAWLSSKNWHYRLGAGIGLSFMAVVVFVSVSQQRSVPAVFIDVFHIKNTHHLVQVFMEDFAIALLLSRFAAALGRKYFIIALISVGLLFAGGHIPNNLDQFGITFSLISLLLDAGLLTIAGILLYHSKDFLWIWPIHFAMDMMQFYSGLS